VILSICIQEKRKMALVRLLRGGQVTVPAEIRKKFRVKEGDYRAVREVRKAHAKGRP
jgi:AbrB family looped-hinge helix DNA binding protein